MSDQRIEMPSGYVDEARGPSEPKVTFHGVDALLHGTTPLFRVRDHNGKQSEGVRELRIMGEADDVGAKGPSGDQHAQRPGVAEVVSKIKDRQASRRTHDPDFHAWAETRPNGPRLDGLAAVRASASAQFTASGFAWMMENVLPGRDVTVVDLRQESHAFFLGVTVQPGKPPATIGSVVTWIADKDIKDHALRGASTKGARQVEDAIVANLRKHIGPNIVKPHEKLMDLASARGATDVFAPDAAHPGFDDGEGLMRFLGEHFMGIKLCVMTDPVTHLVISEDIDDNDFHVTPGSLTRAPKNKALWPLWTAELLTPCSMVLSEEEVLRRTSRRASYLRIAIPDHEIPEHDADVDAFVEAVASRRADQWFHFHCRGGKGRTTTFLCLYDAIRNARNEALHPLDFVYRQWLLGGSDLDSVIGKVTKDNLDVSYKFRPALDRARFCRNFVVYVKETALQTPWSKWAADRQCSIRVSPERKPGEYPLVTAKK